MYKDLLLTLDQNLRTRCLHPMNITLKTLEENQDVLKAKFGINEEIAYANVRMTQLSIARFYGGCAVQGKYFVYNPTDDSLIRGDVIKWLSKRFRSKA